jgi:carboxylesterase type B
VLVFIHGGNFRDGGAGSELYNGTLLAGSQNIIVAVLQYRLGAFGALLTAPDTSKDPLAATGNYMLQDQAAALRFLQATVGSFGGDPARISIWGQSAVAMSVACHLISPSSAGLFQGAFMESEPFSLPFRDVPAALDLSAALTEAAGCSGASPSATACLRALSAPALLAAQLNVSSSISANARELLQIFMPFSPTTGTPELPNWPLDSMQALPGSAPVADVPVVLGTSSEGTLFIWGAFGAKAMNSSLEYDAILGVFFGLEEALRVGLQYPIPAPAPNDLKPLLSNVTTAAIFRCASRNASASLAARPARKSPVFVYEVSRLLSWSPAMWLNISTECDSVVCHGGDLPLWWQPHDEAQGAVWNVTQELELSQAMQS